MSGFLSYPPPGLESDWSNEGYAPRIRVLTITLLVLTTLFLGARLYARVGILKSFGVDDVMCLIAYGLTVAETSYVLIALENGFGRHAYNIPISKAKALNLDGFILALLPGPCYLFIKLTFFLTYARIFSPSKYMRYLIWGGVAVTVAFYVGDFFYDLFQCQPVAKAWDPTLEGHCALEALPGGPTGIFNVISDFYILVLPMPVVLSLNTSLARRIKLCAVFSLGLFTCAMSVTRLATTIKNSRDPDFSYADGPIFIWANLELSVGLIVACMIVCPVIWDRVLSQPFENYWTRIYSAYRSMVSLRGDSSSTSSQNQPWKTASNMHSTVTPCQRSPYELKTSDIRKTVSFDHESRTTTRQEQATGA